MLAVQAHVHRQKVGYVRAYKGLQEQFKWFSEPPSPLELCCVHLFPHCRCRLDAGTDRDGLRTLLSSGTSQLWALAPQSPYQGALSYPFPTVASGMAPASASIGSRGIPATCNAQYVTYAVRLDILVSQHIAVNTVDGCGAQVDNARFRACRAA